MGKASSRKRDRETRSKDLNPSPPQVARLRRTSMVLGIGAVIVLVAVLSLWFLQRGTVEPSILLPDPDTSNMTAPVQRAIHDAREAALSQPESADALGRLAQIFHAHWLYDEAAACYERARELAPRDVRWVYLLAGVEEIRGADGEQVRPLFRTAIRLAPRYPPVYVRYGDALMRLGQWDEARKVYAQAVERDSELALAHRGLGQAALQLVDGPGAVEALERAAVLEPEDRIVHAALARAYALAGRREQAQDAARKAEASDEEAQLPDPIFFDMESLAVDPRSLRDRAARAMQGGDYPQAIEALTLLAESAGASADEQLGVAHKLLANQYAFQGDFESALLEFERAARLAPRDPEIEHNWGTVLLRQGDSPRAEPHFRKAIELNPASADSLYNLGVTLENQNRTEEAVEVFARAAAIQPQHVAAQRLAELESAAH